MRAVPRSKPTSTSTIRLREYFHSISMNTNSGGTVGRSIVNVTPTKRKLLQSNRVAQLVPVFETNHIPVISPGERESIEDSPAKRLRLESGVKHLASQ